LNGFVPTIYYAAVFQSEGDIALRRWVNIGDGNFKYILPVSVTVGAGYFPGDILKIIG